MLTIAARRSTTAQPIAQRLLLWQQTTKLQRCRPQVSTLLVAPVAPHWAEEVWTAKLRRPGCVITAGWPAAAEPNMVLQVPATCPGACA